MDFAKLAALLQVGFAGFAAFMAILAFWLSSREIARQRRSERVLEHILKFCRYTLMLAVLVIVSSVGKAYLDMLASRESRRSVTLSQSAQDCREALDGLIGSEGKHAEVQSLRLAMLRTREPCVQVMRNIEELDGTPAPR